MRRIVLRIVILTVAAGLAAGTAWSLGPGEEGGPGFGRRFGPQRMPLLADPAVAEQLGLTEEQVSQLHALRFQSARTGIEQRARMQVLHLELEELLRAEQPDRSAIDAKLRQLSDVRHALMKSHIEHRLNLREALTAEQRRQLKSLLRERMEQRRHHRGIRRGPGRGRFGAGERPGAGFGPGFGFKEPPLE